jgi:hypothetical protein
MGRAAGVAPRAPCATAWWPHARIARVHRRVADAIAGVGAPSGISRIIGHVLRGPSTTVVVVASTWRGAG